MGRRGNRRDGGDGRRNGVLPEDRGARGEVDGGECEWEGEVDVGLRGEGIRAGKKYKVCEKSRDKIISGKERRYE